MDEIQRRNSASVKADFRELVEKVKSTKEPLIVQKNNIDQVAIVPLETLRKAVEPSDKKGRP